MKEQPPRRWRRFYQLRGVLRDARQRHRMLFVAGLLVLGAVSASAYFTYRYQALPFDLDTTLYLQGIRFAPFYRLMLTISQPGYAPWSALLVASISLIVALRLGWKEGLYLLFVTGLQGLSNHAIKTAIGRPRPADNLVEVLLPSGGNSFPSGHVMFYTVFFGFLFFLVWTRLRRSGFREVALLLTGGMVLLIGPSRIYLGAHWLSDVVAAYLLSVIILLFAIEFYVELFVPARSAREEVRGMEAESPSLR